MNTPMTASGPAGGSQPSFAQREPALTYGGGLTGAALIIDAIVGLGIPLTDTPKIAIILVVSVVGPFAGTILTRMKVSPVLVQTLETDAKDALENLGGLAHPEVVQSPMAPMSPEDKAKPSP